MIFLSDTSKQIRPRLDQYAEVRIMTSYGRSLRMLKIFGILLLTSFLLFPAPPVQSAEDSSEYWDEWKPLASGYMARRKVPAHINKSITERRYASVQATLSSTQQVKEQLLIQHSSTVTVQQQLATIDQQLEQFQFQRIFSRNFFSIWQNSIWLHTGQAGLYGISIAEIARQLGESESSIRRKASHGKLALTNEDQPTSWYYDEATDSVLFAGAKYTTFYTDQNAYKLKTGFSWQAQSMDVIDGSPQGINAGEHPFTETLHFEKEPDMMYSTWTVAAEQDADYWFWDYLYGGYKDQLDIPLEIPNPATEGTAHISITMRGWTDLEPGDEHQVYAKLNGQTIGTMISWDGFAEAVLAADIDQSLLNADGNNTLTLHNSYTPGTHPGQWLDQIEFEYSRQPVAMHNMLWLRTVEGGDQLVTGFTSEDLLVIQDPAGAASMLGDIAVTAEDGGTWTAGFTSQEGTDYLVVDRSEIKTASLSIDNASHLAWRYNAADYLIIAPRPLEGTAEAMAGYQQGRFDFVKTVWLDDIYNEFSYGRVDPKAITRFMERTQHWWVAPSYVLLVGKGTLDEKNRMGYSDSFLPVLMTTTPWALAASDTRLLGINSNPSLFAIGRLPVTSDSEGMAYVSKLQVYEAQAADELRLKAILAADNPDDAGDFHLNSDLLATRLLDTLGFTDITKLYHPDDNIHDSLILSETWNTGYVSYDGHGSATRAGDYQENFLNAGDVSTLANTLYPIFTALTCAVADDTLPGTRSLAGSIVLNPTGGAIASLAPTGLSLDSDAQKLGMTFVDTLFAEGNTNTIGDALIEASLQNQGTISDFMPRIYEIVGDPSVFAR